MTIATSDELRDWLSVPGQIDASNAPHLDLALDAAEEAVTEYTGRTWGTTGSATRYYDGPGCKVYTDELTAVTLLEESADRESWTTRTDYWLEPANDTVKYRVVSTTPFARWVRVTGTFGDPAPSAVKLAQLMIAARLWTRRRSATGTEGFGEFGVVRITRATDPDVAKLLDPLRRMDKVAGIA